MKKILLVHNKYRQTGGEDIAVKNEIDFLKVHFEVEVLYFENNIDNLLKQFFYFLINKNLKSKKQLLNKLEVFNPDVVYVHNTWFKASVEIFNILKKRNIKTIIKLHNYRFHCTKHLTIIKHIGKNELCQACGIRKKKFSFFNKYFQESYLKSFLIYFYNKRFLNVIKDEYFSIVTLTNFQFKFLIENNYRKNVKLRKLENILDVENNVASKKDNEKILVYAGRISKEKGVEEIITSFQNSKLNEFKLKIIGSGPDLDYLRKKFLNEKVEFLGFLPNEQVKKIINSSAAVVSATKLFEGQPTLINEACLLRKPIIFPKSGGISEYLSKNNPFLFKQYDYSDLTRKLNLLLNEELITDAVENNYQHALKIFDKENFLQSFNEVIDG